MDKLPFYEAIICEIYDKDSGNCANCGERAQCTGFTFKFFVAGFEVVACCANFQKEGLERMKERGLPLVLSRESVDALKNMDGCKNE